MAKDVSVDNGEKREGKGWKIPEMGYSPPTFSTM
jgi:hypothetical protein